MVEASYAQQSGGSRNATGTTSTGSAAEPDGSCHRCSGGGRARGSAPLCQPYGGPRGPGSLHLTVDPSHVGAVVSVPGSGGPLNAQAFRLWQNGRPMAVRVNPLPASALRMAVVVDAGPGAQLQGAQNAVADLMIG